MKLPFFPSDGLPFHWTLPGELVVRADDDAAPGRYRRTVRDWAADLTLFIAAVLFWAVEWDNQTPSDIDGPAWFGTVGPWLGALACIALWWRRRYPVALVWAMMPVLLISGTATGASMVAILTVAIHRRWQTAVIATIPYAVMGGLAGTSVVEAEASTLSAVITVLATMMIFVTPMTWGVALRNRRQLVVSLHRDAERERREHELRLAGARRAERERIAREMHDVLAHRISLLSVHAGALAYRTTRTDADAAPALDPAEVSNAVAVIRDNANHALADLGDVLKVLRMGDPEDDDGTQPQVSLNQIPRLIGEADAVGQRVTLDAGSVLEHRDAIRPQVQRTAYRVVQEGLTNARKHAPGSDVVVRVDGVPGGELTVTVTNPLPSSTIPSQPPGAGVGLTGLGERVALDGGTLEHGGIDGVFRLHVRLPWPHDRASDRTGQGAAG